MISLLGFLPGFTVISDFSWFIGFIVAGGVYIILHYVFHADKSKKKEWHIMKYDLIIKNGLVIFRRWRAKVEVGVKDGKIAAIGQELGEAEQIVDAKIKSFHQVW